MFTFKSKKLGFDLQSSTSFYIFDFASTFRFINNMPRVKQSPRKNPRDLPNPINWVSILRNNHCKYFYLNFCGSMQWDGYILQSDRCTLRWDGYKPLILKTFILLYTVNLFNFAVGCGGTGTGCSGMGTFCSGAVVCCGGMVNSIL